MGINIIIDNNNELYSGLVDRWTRLVLTQEKSSIPLSVISLSYWEKF